MAELRQSFVLDAPPETVWALLQRPATLLFLARGRVTLKPVDPPAFPHEWDEREYRVRLLVFGWLPLGWQVIGIDRQEVTELKYLLHDRGRGKWFRTWDHTITVEAAGGGRTRYRDHVVFDAGWLTPLLMPVIHNYFSHRERRWKELVKRNVTSS